MNIAGNGITPSLMNRSVLCIRRLQEVLQLFFVPKDINNMAMSTPKHNSISYS